MGFFKKQGRTLLLAAAVLLALGAAVGAVDLDVEVNEEQSKQFITAVDNGDKAFNSGDYDRAFREYTEAIRLYPRCGKCYANRGMIYGEKGDYDKGIADLSKYIKIYPDDGIVYSLRAMYYFLIKNYDKAIADYESALRLGGLRDDARKTVIEDLAEARQRKAAAGGGSSVSPSPAPQPQYQPSAPAVDASGTLTDSRDGKRYRTVVIGGKRWMAENLNYQTGKSWCYGNNSSYCSTYGRLYDWNTARTACPSGYHLPSREEWQSLVDYAGGDKAAGKKLKARSGWKDNYSGKSGSGTDDYGFSALPVNFRSIDGTFDGSGQHAGTSGFWWSATVESKRSDYAYSRNLSSYFDAVLDNDNYQGFGFSVRCVAD